MKEVLKEHYSRLADSYDQFLYYSPDFVRRLSSKMIECLELAPGDRMVDLGCGTGMYSADIRKQVPMEREIVGVDPFQEMLDGIPADAGIRPVCDEALAFSRREGEYDKVLMKEAVHHVDDREELLRNLHDRLAPGGRVLLVHVPPKLHYPVFRAALERSERWLADPDELEVLLEEVGFRVERDSLDHLHSLPKHHYFAMVENRYMSVLSSFDDDEIREGLAEMEERYADLDTLEFVDHFDYLTGIRA